MESEMLLQLPNEPLVWIDLETTGLKAGRHKILEIACIITDGQLQNEIAAPDIVIKRDDEELANMDEWARQQHTKTGLLEQVKRSDIDIKTAEKTILDFVKQHVPNKKVGILAGSSVHFDKEFLRWEMPKLYRYLHYRIVDVSTIGELVKRWFPTVLRRRPKKKGDHRALDDIKDSINELKFYKDNVFRIR